MLYLFSGHLISWKFSYSFWDVAYSEVRANQLRARGVFRKIFVFSSFPCLFLTGCAKEILRVTFFIFICVEKDEVYMTRKPDSRTS